MTDTTTLPPLPEREDFEKWAPTRGLSLATNRRTGAYVYADTARAWEAWQAALAQSAQPPSDVRDALAKLIAAVQQGMHDEWECNSYHPSLHPALNNAIAALAQSAQAPAPDTDELQELRRSLDFYKRRVDLLLQWQSHMRDPERTIVCDIIANARTLPDPNGARYGVAQAPAQPAVLPSEALFGFAGWLTSRDEVVTLSSRHDAAIAAQLVARGFMEPLRHKLFTEAVEALARGER